MDADNMQKFIASYFVNRGKADFKSLDKFDLAGFENFMDDIVNGSGIFRAFTRGKYSKHAKFWQEVDDQGLLKNAVGPWLKMAESVAFDHLKNDIKLIDKEVRAWKWVKVPDPDNPGKFKQIKEYGKYKSWAPTSHFQRIIDSTHGMAEYVTGMRHVLEEQLQETLGSRIVEGVKSKKNQLDPIFDIAWREIEANGKIVESKKGRNQCKSYC